MRDQHMTPEEINIACAELIGLFKIKPLRRTTRRGKEDPNGVVLWYCDVHPWDGPEYARLPDFYNSLNACQKLVPFIHDGAKWGEIAQDVVRWHVVGVVPDDYGRDLCKLTALCNMTSQQKTEVFLKMHGRWVE